MDLHSTACRRPLLLLVLWALLIARIALEPAILLAAEFQIFSEMASHASLFSLQPQFAGRSSPAAGQESRCPHPTFLPEGRPLPAAADTAQHAVPGGPLFSATQSPRSGRLPQAAPSPACCWLRRNQDSGRWRCAGFPSCWP